VVLLPRSEATEIRLHKRRAGRDEGMNRDDYSRQPPAQSEGSTRAIAASTQWHDAELAMKVARHSFERWLVADHEDTLSPKIMHAYHTHVALHEAARAIATLIEEFRVEAAALSIGPVHGADIPAQRR
jgi:hypothetical protein